MSGPVSVAAISTSSISVICLTGTVVPRTGPDIFQRGTHLLVGPNNQVIAVLRSNTLDLNSLNGQFVTVCGTNEGQVAGVPSLIVTQVFPPGTISLSVGQAGGIGQVAGLVQPAAVSQPPNLSLLVLQLLLQRPDLLQQVSPNLLVSLISSAGLSTSASVSI